MLPYGRQSIDEARRRGGHGGAARRLADHRPGRRRASSATSPATPARRRAVSVTSGTAALHVAYAAAGVGPGRRGRHDAADLRRHGRGAPPCWARRSSSPTSRRTPATSTRPRPSAAVTTRTTVVTGVDYAGHPVDVDALRAVADRRRRPAARGRRPLHRRRRCAAARSGTLADLTTFSFFPTKNLTTAEGGAVASARPGAARARPPVQAPSAWCATATACGTPTRARGTRRCTSSG